LKPHSAIGVGIPTTETSFGFHRRRRSAENRQVHIRTLR
jgi:hypothetical protein